MYKQKEGVPLISKLKISKPYPATPFQPTSYPYSGQNDRVGKVRKDSQEMSLM